jgi:hypothetical protein
MAATLLDVILPPVTEPGLPQRCSRTHISLSILLHPCRIVCKQDHPFGIKARTA